MYISLEEFEQNVQKYMSLAKKVDLLIVDAMNTTVWTLRCKRDALQTRLAKIIRDAHIDQRSAPPFQPNGITKRVHSTRSV